MQQGSSRTTSRHILIVEPDPLFRLLLCVAFSGQFSAFSAVARFDEARTLLQEQTFAAVIVEYHLPGGTGLSLYHEVRRVLPTVPFVLMCGGLPISVPDPRYCFFGKPFGVSDLADTLRQMLAENRAAKLPSDDPFSGAVCWCEALRITTS